MGIMGDPDYEAGIFHDFENCKITGSNRSIGNLVGRVQSRLRAFMNDGRYWVGATRVYAGNAATFRDQSDHRLMERAGFEYFPTPSRQYECDMCEVPQLPSHLLDETGQFNRNFDRADCLLIEEMLGRAVLGTLPPVVVMITNDKDFNIAMHHLYQGNYTLFSLRNILLGEIEVRRPDWAEETFSWSAFN